MKKVIPALLLSFSLLGTTVSVSAAPPEHSNYKERYIPVQLLGMNDFHGQLDVYGTVAGKKVGGAEYLAAYLKEYEADAKRNNTDTLKVHVGDAIGASAPTSALLQDEPTIELFNELDMDVATVGNHEFDEGIEEMMRLINGGEHEATGYFEGANFPFTVANVMNEETGEPILPPYVIKKVNGMPIGFIGVVTTETPNIVVPSAVEGIEFTDEVEAINKTAAELKDKGVQSIVVLAHNPVLSDQDGSNPSGDVVEFANEVDDEIDVIYGAHNHSYANTIVDNKLIVQSYANGTAFSDVDLMIDPKTKDIVHKEAEIVTTYHEGIEPDTEVKEMVDSYKAKVAPLVNEVIGEATDPLTRKQDDSGESALGNFTADSQRAVMGTDIAFMNPGGIRADLDAGDITWGEVYTTSPFGNSLVSMELTGEQIKSVLEQQWSGSYQRILQISGLQYTWDQNAPIGERIVEITDDEGNPINPDQTYTVTANNYLATGGDGFTVFKEGKNPVNGPVDYEAMVEYIKSFEEPIQAPALDRIDVQ
ncbi:bifunctional metallophosphatase/5'-nucleotidase [Oceanobacillus sp. 143]|uniref:Bifunctional metallophosphatase/5'-nucleotidase n=1 Tax=Oceanobacillus zhaokaii TaxID=2052660 RepID=A0A345PMK4_9BACI|nr:5'-nucleotidase C-terminal domain-containing protein [Oceanobacillus zhaokaii]AXI11234.1 bifunctional metallophosphatase/5'-nucleotidase [Oceanobacillus zhaokaii]QGS69991.1 bifunctional metallophosphatase/5'-nucleotidase [Oceanobacillus sp. 143]